MQILKIQADRLKLDPHNERAHNRLNVEAIKRSLMAFGQRSPIVVNQRLEVLKGNGTLVAARELGWAEIFIVQANLTPEQEKAYKIADNKTGDLSSWDLPKLSETMKQLSEEMREATGFQDYELKPLISSWTPPEVNEDSDLDFRRPTTYKLGADEAEAVQTAIELFKSLYPGCSEAEALRGIAVDWVRRCFFI